LKKRSKGGVPGGNAKIEIQRVVVGGYTVITWRIWNSMVWGGESQMCLGGKRQKKSKNKIYDYREGGKERKFKPRESRWGEPLGIKGGCGSIQVRLVMGEGFLFRVFLKVFKQGKGLMEKETIGGAGETWEHHKRDRR